MSSTAVVREPSTRSLSAYGIARSTVQEIP